MMSMVPSGIVMFHAHKLITGSGFATAPQFTVVIEGLPPLPKLETLNEMLAIT